MINYSDFKKFFIFNFVISLIIVALVAVVTVLVGEFNEISSRVLSTLFMMVLHSLVALLFIRGNEKDGTFGRMGFFVNILFLLIVMSFLTSIFGIWDIIVGQTVFETYMVFGVLAFAALHGNILAFALNRKNYIDFAVYLNYVFMAIVVAMIVPIIYINNAMETLGELYFRVLGANAILDSTLTILVIIFYRIYVHYSPKVEDPMAAGDVTSGDKKEEGMSIWVWILIVYLVLQFGLPLFFGNSFFRYLF